MHNFSEPERQFEVSPFEWPSTPLTGGSDISLPDVIPPTPPLEAVSDATIRVQKDDYGFPDVVAAIEESVATDFLKPTSPFLSNAASVYGATEALDLPYPRHAPRRKGLLIGIKFGGVAAPVEGAHDDVDDMKRFLVHHYRWREEDLLVLKDDGTSTRQPTRDVIIAEMHDLVQNARAGDELFFHYSGHGGQIPDMDGDEVDGLDEVIYSVDKLHIVDDEMYDVMVKPLPAGCRLTALIDCCSSGTTLDLPITAMPPSVKQAHPSSIPSTRSYEPGNSPVSPWWPSDEISLDLPHNYQCLPSTKFTSSPSHNKTFQTTQICPANANHHPSRPTYGRRCSAGDVIMWAACQDSERSHEVLAYRDRRMKGAMTHAFIECLQDRKQQTYRELLDALDEALVLWGCPQRPMLSSAHRINMHDIVTL